MSSKQQIAVSVDVTASGTHITLVVPTDTGRMEVIYSEFHPMPPAQRQRAQGDGWIPLSERLSYADGQAYYEDKRKIETPTAELIKLEGQYDQSND